MRLFNIGRDERDFHSEWLRRCVGGNMAGWQIHFAQLMCCKGKGGFASFQLAVSSRLMQEPARKAKSLLKKLERGRDVGSVNDGVAELHMHVTP